MQIPRKKTLNESGCVFDRNAKGLQIKKRIANAILLFL